MDWGNAHMLRVTTCYWKSQRKIGHLVKINELGDMIQEIVGEDYKVTDKPLYDTTVYKNKTKDNLVFGEHIDWIWINEVWGGVKVGPNRPSFWGMNNPGGLNPIYLGMQGGRPGRIPFQFKGDNSLYGDQNALPRHSMGEDWGKGNLQNAYVAMKNFQMLPLDTTITNTENALNFQHYQVLNLEQTQRLLSRIQLAGYFKQQAYEVIGVTAQRMGQQMGQQTATGMEQNLNASYTQTEMYFVQHTDYLMPRVHQMRTELAQYYNSNNPSIRLQYVTSAAEKTNFAINGTKLLMRDLNVFCTTKMNSRAVMEQLKQLALNNNTTGASIYDLGNIIKSESIAELTNVLKASEEKAAKIRQEQAQQEQQMQEQQLAAQERQKQAELQAQADRDDKFIQRDLLVAEIRAAGMGAGVDINQNQMSDYQDAMAKIQQQQNYTDSMNLKREQEVNKNRNEAEKLSVERERLAAQKEIADKQLQIARENKNKYDVKEKPTKK